MEALINKLTDGFKETEKFGTVVKTDRVATLIGKNGQAHAHMVMLSPKFVGVISSRGAKVGTRLEVKFEIPAFGYFTELKIPAIVTERHDTQEGIFLTLMFENIDEKSLAAIQDFIEYKKRLHESNLHHTVPSNEL